MVNGLWYIMFQIGLSFLILKVQRTSMSFKSSFRALEDAGEPWLEFGISILIWIWSLAFDILMIQILALFPCPLSPDFGIWRMLEDPDGGVASWSWFGYGPWSLVHPCSKFGLSTIYFEGARNSHVLQVLIWGFAECWRFLTGVLDLFLISIIVTGLW